MPHAVAVILARAGSRGIPGKNLRQLGGKPLVVHAIEAAQQARLIDKIILSTDGDDIALVGKSAGITVYDRPPHLAADTAATIDVLVDILETFDIEGRACDELVLLEPTSPFRTGEIIDRCIEKLRDGRTQTVVTVTQLERNPHNILSVSGDNARFYIIEPRAEYQQRQQFVHLQRLNGCVYALRADNLKKGRRILTEPIRVEEMPAERSINIDSMLDLELARLLAPKLL